MARKTQTLTITDDGRDKGKRFVLTEMPAYQGIKWADRCLLAIAASGAKLPDGAMGSGMLGLLAAGVTALDNLEYDVVAPLLDELMSCAAYQPNPNQPNVTVPVFLGEGCQIEEIKTFWSLRVALFQLMTGFTMAADGQTIGPQPTTSAA